MLATFAWATRKRRLAKEARTNRCDDAIAVNLRSTRNWTDRVQEATDTRDKYSPHGKPWHIQTVSLQDDSIDHSPKHGTEHERQQANPGFQSGVIAHELKGEEDGIHRNDDTGDADCDLGKQDAHPVGFEELRRQYAVFLHCQDRPRLL